MAKRKYRRRNLPANDQQPQSQSVEETTTLKIHDEGDEMSQDNGPDFPIENALLMAACIGAIKDPISGGPMDDANFNNCLPRYIQQAYTLYVNVLNAIQTMEARKHQPVTVSAED